MAKKKPKIARVYKWDKENGLVDENGLQLLQIIAVNESTKRKNKVGNILAEVLNMLEDK